MKNIFCMIGLHRLDQNRYLIATRYHKNGKKYHKNYFICERCGKKLGSFAKVKTGGHKHGI